LLHLGARPSLAAAIHGPPEGLSAAVLAPQTTGGQAATSSLIHNYLGSPARVTGHQAVRACTQACNFGAEYVYDGRRTWPADYSEQGSPKRAALAELGDQVSEPPSR
jgi:thioredoxin reductase